jgi:hypothetical protein
MVRSDDFNVCTGEFAVSNRPKTTPTSGDDTYALVSDLALECRMTSFMHFKSETHAFEILAALQVLFLQICSFKVALVESMLFCS